MLESSKFRQTSSLALKNDMDLTLTICSIYAEIMAFGTGIKLTNSEKKLTAPVCTASVTALTLGNDFWSWRKEYDQYLEGGGIGEMKNAVYILMKQHKVGPQDAMELCKQLTVE